MRGKDTIITELANVLRITPACAGKSRCAWLAACHRRDHPRVCGEKRKIWSGHHQQRGSPPRVRGKVFPCGCCPRREGITPACAGKSSFCVPLLTPSRDHPRVCGEKKKMQPRKDKRMGSPPRVRGKALMVTSHSARTWITPACAGKSRRTVVRPAR